MSRRLLRHFNSVAEAEVAASFLRARGFDAQLPDRQFLSANPEFGLSSGGYRIDVPTAEHYRATLLLAEVDGPAPRPRRRTSLLARLFGGQKRQAQPPTEEDA